MSNPPKKPPVVAIRGSYQPDVIAQSDLIHAADLQAAVWLAEKAARECVQRIEERCARGATIEDGEMIFDRDLQMARSRKRKEGSA